MKEPIWIGLKNKNMRTHHQTLVVLAFILFSSCGGKLKTFENAQAMVADAKSEIQTISVEEFKKLLDSGESLYLIDCRESVEFDSSCIRTAINIPRGKIEEELSAKAPNHLKTVYVYCNNGDRSALTAQILPGFKYSCVKVIEGGFENWKTKFPADVELHPVRGGAGIKAVKPAGGCGG